MKKNIVFDTNDNPILNNPFEEPKECWIYEKGQPKRMSGRRPAGYYFRTGKRSDAQTALFTEEQFVELELVNKIRQRVKEWREGGYRGVTERLLQHWNSEDRERKLFFCQPIPKYFQLWKTINKSLPASEKATQKRKPKPESVFRESKGALTMLAGEWKKTFEELKKKNSLSRL